jgi:hypothetical protein
LLADFPILLIVGVLGGTFASVVVVRIFLDAASGRRPTLIQLTETAQYPGFLKLAWRLYLRYVGWGLSAGLIVSLLMVVGIVAIEVFVGDGRRVDLPRGWVRPVIRVIFVVVNILYSRYAFAMPLFAQRRGAATDLIAESIQRVRPVWLTIALVCAAELVFSLSPSDFERVIRGHFALAYWVRVLLAMGSTVLDALIRTWFVMVLTGLMLQTELHPVPEQGLPDGAEAIA